MLSPLTVVLAALLVVRVVGVGWGLPASDGWDNDGVAPRDFLVGLVKTFTPGQFYTYPPLHPLLLGVLTLPVTAVALARAPSLAQVDVVSTIIAVPYMTAIALVARALSILMSLVVVWALAKIGEELSGGEGSARGRRVAVATAVVAGLNASLTYYAHTSNLDVPYLCWGTLAVLELVRAIARDDERRLRRVATYGVLAIATKDQAYALFALLVPVALCGWAWARGPRGAAALSRTAGKVAVASVLGLLVADAALVNPSGFRARVAFLAGPASQDYAHYANDWRGRLSVLEDIAANFAHYYPTVLAPLAVASLLAAPWWVLRASAEGAGSRGEVARLRVAAAVPLLAAVSFTVAFNWVARRTEHRFAMPQYLMLAVYGGLAAERAAFAARAATRWVGRALLASSAAAALFACLTVDASFLLDPRYDAERWLREHAAPGDVIEVYGLNVYMPRLPAGARVVRVGHEPLSRRNPLPGVEERQAPFREAHARGARFLVVSEGWVWRYLLDPDAPSHDGRVLPKTQIATGRDDDGATFFQGLFRGERGFREVHRSIWTSRVFRRLNIHASTGRDVWIFERVP